MTIGSIFAGLFKALSSIFGWLQQNQLIKAGQDGAVVTALEKKTHEIETAVAAREEARAESAAVPVTDSLPDDGFRRD